MTIDTKPNFSSNKFEQCSTDIMNLSGCTQIFGKFDLESGATFTVCTNARAGSVFTSDAGGVGTWQVPTGEGITELNAGEGMNFPQITTTGTIVLGTPSSITTESANSVGATTHSHYHDASTFVTGEQGILVAGNKYYLDDTYLINTTLPNLHSYSGITSNQSIGTITSGDTLGMVYITNTGSSTGYLNLGTTPTGNDITPYQTIEVAPNEDVSVTVNMRLSSDENSPLYVSSDDWTNVGINLQWANISYQNVSSSDVPIASETTLGVIRVGDGLSIDVAGILNVTGGTTGGTSVNAANGLTYDGNNVVLGGTLTGTTLISSADNYSFGFGNQHTLTCKNSFIAGGEFNVSNSGNGFIGGGSKNIINDGSFFNGIAGSCCSIISHGYLSFIGGGAWHRIGDNAKAANNLNNVILGGYEDKICNNDPTYPTRHICFNSILGGYYNEINDGCYNALIGGQYNCITGKLGQVGGACNEFNVVAGGKFNVVDGNFDSGIVGGAYNSLGGGNDCSVIIGGDAIVIAADALPNHAIVPNLAIYDAPSSGTTNDLALVWDSADKKVKTVVQSTGGTGGGSGGFRGTVTKDSAVPSSLSENQWVKPEPMSTNCFNYTFDNFLDSGSFAISVNLSLEDVFLRYDGSAWVKEAYNKPLSNDHAWVGNGTCEVCEVCVIDEWVNTPTDLTYTGQKYSYQTQNIFQTDVAECVTVPNKILIETIDLKTIANHCIFTIPSGKTGMISNAKLIMLNDASPTSFSVSIGNNCCVETPTLSFQNMICNSTIDDVLSCEVYDFTPVLGGAGICNGSCCISDVYFRVQSASTSGNPLCAHLLVEGYIF